MLLVFSTIAAADTLAPATLPADGQHHADLQVEEFGRYSIVAQSTEGVAIQLVDRMAGPLERSGLAGARDGRLDAFLSRGAYRVLTEGAPGSTGEVLLALRRFEELNDEALELGDARTVETTLGDFQQRSYWIRLSERQQVDLEAAGRRLEDLRLWQEGTWLIDAAPRCSTVNPTVGQPLTDCTLSLTLDAGLYRVTAYGGEGLEWMRDDGTDPLIVRRGIPDLGSVGQLQTTISAIGVDRWRVSSAWVQLALPEPEAVLLSIRDAGSDPYRTGGTTRQITMRSERPVVSAALRGRRDRIVTVRGGAGQDYQLQHFNPASSPVQLTPADAPVWISTIHSGVPEDTLDATGVILRRDADGLSLDASAPIPLAADIRYERRFNLTSPAGLLLEVEAAGTWSVATAGVDARLQLVPIRLDGTQAPEPISFRGGEDIPLNAGLYQLSITPDEAGIFDLSIRPVHTTGQAVHRVASLQFPSITLDKAGQHSLIFEQQSGARVGVIQRSLPLELAEPLPLTLAPQQSLTVEVQLAEEGLLAARSSQPISAWIDGWEAETSGTSVTPGTRTVRLVNSSDESVFVTLSHTPASRTGGLSGISLDGMPQLPELTAEQPLFFDLEREASTTVGVSVGAPALYVLESTGLLSMSGTLRTQTRPRLDEGVSNGAGRNFRIEQYLREGDYQLTAATQGRSTGHFGVRLTQPTLHDGGEITPGLDARIDLPAGEGVVYRLRVDTPGLYSVDVAREGDTPRCRLETADGWPLRPPGIPASFSHRFSAGEYRLTILPGTTDSRLVTTLREPATTPRREGHGPHALPLDAAVEATWMEPRVEGDAALVRTPDTWTFTLHAPAQTTITLSPEMVGTLWAGEAAVLATEPGQPWSGALPAGEYRMEVRSDRRNHGIPYRLTVATEELTAGRSRACIAPCSVPISVAGSGLVELTSSGRADVRARLYDADEHLIARSDDRPGGWNFQILARLTPGLYRLQVDPVGERSAPVTVDLRQPDEPLLSPLNAPGQVSITPGHDAVLVPISASTSGVMVVGAQADESVGLALEWLDEDVWRVLGETSGTSPRLALPAKPEAAHRLRVWTPDRRGGSVTVSVLAERPARVLESRLRRGVSLPELGGVGLAAVSLSRPGVYLVQTPVTLCSSPGEPCMEAAEGLVALPAGTVTVVGAPQQEVIIERQPLTEGSWWRLALRDVPASWSTPQGTILNGNRNATLVIARANAGQPGLSLDGVQPAISPQAAAAVSLGTPLRFQLWSGIDGTRLIARVRSWRFELPRPDELDWGMSDLSAAPGEAGAWRLPGTQGALRLSLQAGAVAAVRDVDGQIHVRHADGAAIEALLWGAFSELVLLNPTEAPMAARMELLAGHHATPELTPAAPLERQDSRASHLQVVVPDAGEGWSIVMRGAIASASWLGEDGTVSHITGGALPISGGGVLDLHTTPGAAVVWMTSDQGDGLWSLDQAVAATPLQPPAAVPLSGAFQGYTVQTDAPGLLHVHLDIPAILALHPERGQPQTWLLPAGGGRSALVGAGTTTVLVRPVGQGALSGDLTAHLSVPEPVGDGLGPSVVLSAGEERWFSLTVPEDRTIGAGVRADSDRVSARLLDADGNEIAQGAVMMAALPAGQYLLALSLPPDAPPARARPVVAGLNPPDSGPPDAVVRRYLEAQ